MCAELLNLCVKSVVVDFVIDVDVCVEFVVVECIRVCFLIDGIFGEEGMWIDGV